MNNKRIVLAALAVAASAPRKQAPYTTDARVPWRLINELREALEEKGIDWEKVHDQLRVPS